MTRAFFILALSVLVCLPRPAKGDEPTADKVGQAVDRALKFLTTESSTWRTQRTCAACHHLGMPLWALSEADRCGYTIDKKYLDDSMEAILGSNEKLIASRLIPGPKDPPDPRPLAKGVVMGTIFLSVVAESRPALEKGQQQTVTWINSEAIKKQREDGSWDMYLSRPPINENQATETAWVIMALQGEKDHDALEAQRPSLEKAMTWLAKVDPADNPQVERLKLLVALRSGESREKLQPALDHLLSLQNPDGGWSQLPHLRSDAFATGQSLYVLALAHYSADHPQVKRGIEFLLSTQNPDGSWPMISRSSPDGRPGSAKLLTPIQCGAGSWSVMSLARLFPKNAPN